jgi:hypothetical protein
MIEKNNIQPKDWAILAMGLLTITGSILLWIAI